MTSPGDEALLRRFGAEYFDRHNTSAGRRADVLAELRGLAATLPGGLTTITPSDLMAWQGAQARRGLAPTTIAKRTTMTRVFVGWMASAGIVSHDLTTQLKSIPTVAGGAARNRPRPYKRHEIAAFRELLDARLPLCPTTGRGQYSLERFKRTGSQYAWSKWVRSHASRLQLEAQVSLALEEGLRRLEIHSLALSHLAPDNDALIVRSVKTAPGVERWREIPWTNHSRECVRAWLDFRRVLMGDRRLAALGVLVAEHTRPWLMLKSRPEERITPLSFVRFARTFEKWPGDWRWHRFRHTFATERLRAGMPLEQVQQMLGHARLEQTLGYAEIVSADVRLEAARTSEQFERNLGLVLT